MLYLGFLEIRWLSQRAVAGTISEVSAVGAIEAIADWMHNPAVFAIKGFDGFDERRALATVEFQLGAHRDAMKGGFHNAASRIKPEGPNEDQPAKEKKVVDTSKTAWYRVVYAALITIRAMCWRMQESSNWRSQENLGSLRAIAAIADWTHNIPDLASKDAHTDMSWILNSTAPVLWPFWDQLLDTLKVAIVAAGASGPKPKEQTEAK